MRPASVVHKGNFGLGHVIWVQILIREWNRTVSPPRGEKTTLSSQGADSGTNRVVNENSVVVFLNPCHGIQSLWWSTFSFSFFSLPAQYLSGAPHLRLSCGACGLTLPLAPGVDVWTHVEWLDYKWVCGSSLANVTTRSFPGANKKRGILSKC